MKVREGDKVRVHYKGTLEDGTVFDSSEGGEPLEFEVGTGKIIEGFEKGIMGMEEGEERQLSVPPEKAYGPHRDDMVGKLPAEQTANLDVQPGSEIQVQTKQGEVIKARVIQVVEDGVIVDTNHPLAGETLNFEVKLIGLERGE
ncbi:MAG: peptidylprolyl isomerase [Thermoplasmata archaeon]